MDIEHKKPDTHTKHSHTHTHILPAIPYPPQGIIARKAVLHRSQPRTDSSISYKHRHTAVVVPIPIYSSMICVRVRGVGPVISLQNIGHTGACV